MCNVQMYNISWKHFNMCFFYTFPGTDWRGEMSVHFNTMHDVLGNVPSTEELGPKTLSRITESRETLPASAGAAQSWAITQQFPAVNKVSMVITAVHHISKYTRCTRCFQKVVQRL